MAFSSWAILELMGHRRLAGKVSEEIGSGAFNNNLGSLRSLRSVAEASDLLKSLVIHSPLP